MSVRESPRKHYATQKQNKEKQPKRVFELEAEEGHGTKDIDAEGVESITKLRKYIPSRKGKTKVTKDPYFDKFIISMPLLLEQVPFEGSLFAQIHY